MRLLCKYSLDQGDQEFVVALLHSLRIIKLEDILIDEVQVLSLKFIIIYDRLVNQSLSS